MTLFNIYPAAGASKPPSALDQKTPSCFSSLTGILMYIMIGWCLIFCFISLTSLSYAAENAWRHQGKKKSAVFVTLSWNDAWARAQRWTTDYSGDWHAM
jgi:hypothetical protein